MIAGLGAWCALGTVTLAAPDDAAHRLVAPAPLVWFLPLVLVATAVPAWRKRPWLAAPALLATLPWWPVPLPAVALLWTGPLAWLPVGFALSAAYAATSWQSPASRMEPPVSRRAARPGRLAALAGLLTLALALMTAWSLSPRLPTGDEPHYLIITQSLLLDGDLKIQNNHDRRDHAPYFPETLMPDLLRRGQDGEAYSIHAPGTAVLVLPAFAIFGYRGAQASIVLVSAVTGALVWFAAWLASGDRRAAWFAWLAIVGASTFLIQSVTIFPDGPGACIVAATVVLILRLEDRARPVSFVAVVGVSALLAALPWLHTRFVVLAVGFGLLLTWRLVADQTRSFAARWSRAAMFLIVPALSAALWFWFFFVIYGVADPSAPYGSDPGTRLAYVPGGVVALLFDEQFGLVTYSPVFAALAAAFVVRRRAASRAFGPGLVVVLAYFAAVGTYWMWWAGVPATPARFAAAALPVLAVPLAVGWTRSGPVTRGIWLLLLLSSLAMTAVLLGIDHGVLAWNLRGVRAEWLEWTNRVVNLSRAWPSFFWRLTPGDVSTEWHFGLHVTLWIGVFVVAGLGLSAWIRRRAPETPMLVAAWWLPLTLMAAVQVGWWFNGVTGLAASTSQLDVLHSLAGHDTVLRIEPFAIRRIQRVDGALRVRMVRSDVDGDAGATWDPLRSIPAGTYAVRVTTRRPTGGTLSFYVGRSVRPLQTLPLAPLSDQTATLSVPVGVRRLAIRPDETFAAAAEAVDLQPITLGDGSRDSADLTTRYRDVEVYFLDDATFVEPDGFWIRGGRTAGFVMHAPAGQSSLEIEISNGATDNLVRYDFGAGAKSVPLKPSEAHTLRVPLRDGVVRFTISSPSGFRPSEIERSADHRYLGVRVRVVE